MAAAKNKSGSKKKSPLTPEQKRLRQEKARERAFLRSHRKIFDRAGFDRLVPVDGIHFQYEGQKCELDDIFVFENVVVLAEYTESKGANLGKHAKGKDAVHNKIAEDPAKFLNFFRDLSTGVDAWLANSGYTDNQLIVRLIYTSRASLEDHHKALFNENIFMSDAERGYFSALTRSLRKSARYELLEYLRVDPNEVGESGVAPASVLSDDYNALLLPKEQSHFPSGFKIVSFYVDPDALLRRVYVLRRNGWRDSLGLYQRLIIPSKIRAIRAHLKDKKRVFANNIVVTLPHDTKIEALDGENLSSEAVRPTPINLRLKRSANSIGIIDGQHRVFSYYEDREPDSQIDKYRLQQNLLATGIVYPKGYSQKQREKFEAGLFMEINSTQNKAGSDIIQAIWVLLDPFRPVAVSRVVLNGLSTIQPLSGYLARTSLDAGKIRTSSVVSYGLMPLTKRSGTDSLFAIWNKKGAKRRFTVGEATEADLDKYVAFCVETIGSFLTTCRASIGSGRWRLVKDGGVLSVTTVNGLIILLRKLIDDGLISDAHNFPDLSKIGEVDFNSFKSSQYADLAATMRKKVK
ncbi:ParB N-terminal domain-containing protein [Qipengyuania sp. 483]